PQHYRKCDHQSVQSVLVLESKKKSAMANDSDLFAIVASDPGADEMLRSCSELGHAT
ncbi:MAG: ABC transporter substrate-binding protein, partial [Bradyrhizobium sp.]|nr:ABC transporter substrate-binding protein [Bradyrhizobium sp.]